MDTVTFILPYPPSVNRSTRNGERRPYTPPDVKAYKLECGYRARLQASADMPYSGNVHVVYRFYRPRRSGDTSNRVKVLEDALNGIAWIDDKQVVSFCAARYDDKRQPRVEVEVTEVDHA